MLLQFGRADECLRMVEKARELDPYDISGQSFYGLALIYANRPEDAARHLEKVVARGDLLHPHLILGQAYAILAGKGGPDRDGFLRKALDSIGGAAAEGARGRHDGHVRRTAADRVRRLRRRAGLVVRRRPEPGGAVPGSSRAGARGEARLTVDPGPRVRCPGAAPTMPFAPSTNPKRSATANSCI